MKKSKIPFIPPLLLAGVLVVLVPIFTIMTIDRLDRQKEFFISKLVEKGTSLIRTFEAGTRTGIFTMHWGAGRIQAMLQETVFQPEVDYIFIISDKGKIVAHSDSDQVGEDFKNIPDINQVGQEPSQVFHRVVTSNGNKPVFEVYKRFMPVQRFHKGRHRMMHPMPGWKKDKFPPPPKNGMDTADWSHPYQNEFKQIKDAGSHHYIFAGLSMERGQEIRNRLLKETIFRSIVLFLLGCAGVLVLFALQAYRSTKASLSSVKAFSDNVIQNMPSGLVTMNSNSQITSMNRVAASFFGQDLTSPLPEWLQMIDQLNQSGQLASREMNFENKKGQELHLEVIVSQLESKDGNGLEYLFLFRDLTQIHDLKKEVETNKRLAAIGKLAAGVAHEIRNPLSSIKGFATYFAKRYETNEKDYQTAMVMKGEIERINRSITQLLEFANPLNIEKKPVDIIHLVDHSLRLVAPDLEAKKIKSRVSGELKDATILTDPDRLNQLLLNLYINAIEALEEGGTLDVGLKQCKSETLLEISVKDNGAGIDPAHIDKIFDPYYTTRSTGTGLGLSIVHKIVEKLGGQIRVQSRPGQETCFTILLPIDT